MGSAAPSYRPELLERRAARLNARARTAPRFWAGFVGLTGMGAGATAALLLPGLLPIPIRVTLVAASLLAGALAGLAVGARRARTQRFEAQLLLCSVHVQYGTLAVWKALQERLAALSPVVELPRRPAEVAGAPQPPLSSVAL